MDSYRDRRDRVLPGQYYDVETAKHYNYFRDYYSCAPRTGRYYKPIQAGLTAH